jgi:hypothetical protein
MRRPMTPPMRRYLARFFPAMLAYVGVLVGSLWVIRNLAPTGPLLWALAIAPALPITRDRDHGAVPDRGNRRIHPALLVQAMLWGIGVTLAGCTAWGFLENVGLVEHLPLFMVFPVFCAAMALAQPVVRWRYR